METFRQSAAMPGMVQVLPSSKTAGAFAEQVSVILAQSVIGGLFVGLLAGLVCWLLFDDRAIIGLKVAAIAGVIAMAALYLTLLADARRLLWVRVETPGATPMMPTPEPIKSKDRLVLVNAPKPDMVQRRLEERANGERQERFRQFIEACAGSTAKRDLLQVFTENELAEFRSVLKRLGMARDRGPDPRSGWELVGSAAAICQRLGLQ